MNAITAIGDTDVSGGFPDSPFSEVPLKNYTGSAQFFPADATAANFVVVNDVAVVRRDEFLTYSVINNTNPGLVTPSLSNNRLTLQYAAGQSGNATITIRAFDRFGAFVDASFQVTVT